ncbi:MAG: Ig-like domain-containing protein [Clostridia bacterium]|nr:Ig-like domain-containing protein [Clostridia bacterium]
MKQISKIVSVLLSLALTLPLFGIYVSAATAQSLPYIDDFSGGTISADKGWTASGDNLSVSDGKVVVATGVSLSADRKVTLDFEAVNSGVLVFEADIYTTSMGAYDFISMQSSDGKKLLAVRPDGRGASGTFVNYKNTAASSVEADIINNVNWGHAVQNFNVKIEADFDNNVWRFWQNDTQLSYVNWVGNEFPFADAEAKDAAQLSIILGIADTTLDNVKVYKKVSAEQGTATNFGMLVGDTSKAEIIYTPSNETMADLVWSSSDSTVASVDQNGLITANGLGNAAVTAVSSFYGVSFTYDVQVAAYKAEDITIDQRERIIYTGETLPLTYTTYPANSTAGTVTWESSDNSVATVNSNGVITGAGEGRAKITITGQFGGTASYYINVVVFNDDESVISMSNTDFDKDTATTILKPLSGWIPQGQTVDGVANAAPVWAEGGANSTAGCVKLTEHSYMQKQDLSGLREGDRYTLSFWLKIASLDEGSSALVQIGPRNWQDYKIAKTYYTTDGQWQKKTLEFIVPQGAGEPLGDDNEGRMEIMLRLIGSGEIYYDEIRITNQKDLSDFELYSGGLRLDSYVQGAPLLNTQLHYVPKGNPQSTLITALYDGDRFSELKTAAVTNETLTTNLNDTVDVTKLTRDSSIGVFSWDSLSGMKPLDTHKTGLDDGSTVMSSVYDFFVTERMRGAYGAIGEIYNDDTKALITEYGINTLILNLSPVDGVRIVKDFDKLDEVMDDAEALSEELDVKIFAKMAYGSSQGNVDAPVGNTAFGAFHPGYEHSLYLPCPRAEEYWQAQITDVLSRVATHDKITGVVIDMEMYSGGSSSYGSPCLCDSCVADFDEACGETLSDIAAVERNAYIKQNGMYEDYSEWHKKEITRITSDVRKAIHAVNPNVIIGCMPTYEWLAGTTEGLGTHSMPLMVFSENEYKGLLKLMYGNAAKIKRLDLPAVYVTGLWTTSDWNTTDDAVTPAVSADSFAAKAVEAAKNSMGYWIYSIAEMRKDTNMQAYYDAIKTANEQLEADFAN